MKIFTQKNPAGIGILLLALCLTSPAAKVFASGEMDAASPAPAQQAVVQAPAAPQPGIPAVPKETVTLTPVQVPQLSEMDKPLSLAPPVPQVSQSPAPSPVTSPETAVQKTVPAESKADAPEMPHVFTAAEIGDEDKGYEKIDVAKQIEELKDAIKNSDDPDAIAKFKETLESLQNAYDEGLRQIILIPGGINILTYTDGWSFGLGDGLIISNRDGKLKIQFRLAGNSFLIIENGGFNINSDNKNIFNFNFGSIIPFLTDPFRDLQEGLSHSLKNLFGGD